MWEETENPWRHRHKRQKIWKNKRRRPIKFWSFQTISCPLSPSFFPFPSVSLFPSTPCLWPTWSLALSFTHPLIRSPTHLFLHLSSTLIRLTPSCFLGSLGSLGSAGPGRHDVQANGELRPSPARSETSHKARGRHRGSLYHRLRSGTISGTKQTSKEGRERRGEEGKEKDRKKERERKKMEIEVEGERRKQGDRRKQGGKEWEGITPHLLPPK